MSEEQEKHPDLKKFMTLANLIGENGLDHPATKNFMLNNPEEWQIIKGMLTKQDIEFLKERGSNNPIFNGDNLIITRPTAYLMNTTNPLNALAKKKLIDFINPTPLTIAYEKEKGKKTNEASAEIFLQVELPADVELYGIHDINQYDLNVYEVVCSLWESENEFMTLSMIAREIAPKHETEFVEEVDDKGKVTKRLVKTEEKTNYVKPETRALILNSLKKLADTVIKVDYTKHYDLKGIQDGIVREAGALIELRPVTMRQKGVDYDGFIFNRPLLLRYAKNVEHISTISKKAIDLSTTMTPEIITIRRYILHRYNQIKEVNRNFKRNKSNKGKTMQERHRTIRYEPIMEQVEKVKIDALETKIKMLRGEFPEGLISYKQDDPETTKKQIEKAEAELEKLLSTGMSDKQKRTVRENIASVLADLKENKEFTDFKTASDKGKRAITKAVIII